MPAKAQLVRTAGKIPTVVATGRRQSRSAKARRLRARGVEILGLPSSKRSLDLDRLLKELGRWGMTNVIVEGGGWTLGSFVDQGLADEAVIFVSHRLIGGEQARSALSALGPARIADAIRPAWTKVTRCGEDDVYHLRLAR